jgi:predicted dinucleotide-binding enzyme
MMKISILGAGNVGGALGRAWACKGHDVYFGVPGALETPRRRNF